MKLDIETTKTITLILSHKEAVEVMNAVETYDSDSKFLDELFKLLDEGL